jgi:hypothetical protein
VACLAGSWVAVPFVLWKSETPGWLDPRVDGRGHRPGAAAKQMFRPGWRRRSYVMAACWVGLVRRFSARKAS